MTPGIPRAILRATWLLGLGLSLWPRLGAAQNLDPRIADNALSPNALISHHTSSVLPHLGVFSGVFVDYSNDPLVILNGAELYRRLVAHRVTLEPLVSLGLFNWIEVAVALPLVVFQTGQSADDPAFERRTGLGDLRLSLKTAIVRHEGTHGFGIAAVFDLSFPTGRRDAFIRDGSLTATPRLVFDYRTHGFILGVNIGYHFRKRVVFRDLVVDDEVRISVGALFPLWRERISLSAEANLALGVLAYTAGGTRSQSLDTPVELVSLLRYRDRSGFVVGVGGGVALGPGYGAADFRLLLRLAYHFERPRPLRTSRKPNKGSAPPKAPPVPPFIVERPLSAKDIDLLARNNGDRDGDGIPDAHDKCPDQPEDFDGFEDDDGCPDPDNDQDGIPDHLDKCPNQPETFNGIDDDDGCPDKGPALTIEIKGGEIVLGRAIFFRTGSDQLDKRSNAILDRLAQLLRARWDIRLLAIEGHTDNRGDPDQNVDLSQRRANRVRDYLVGKGIAGFRMRPKGFGAKKPIAANDSDANRAKNRRVVFRILTRRGGSK